MENELNGDQKKPAITLFWDAAQQSVQVSLDTDQIKHWAMAKMVLNEARDIADMQKKMMAAAAMQHQAAEQQRSALIANALKLGKR